MAVRYAFGDAGDLRTIEFPRYLFRFLRDGDHLEESVLAPYLWFSRLDSFNDPLESSCRIRVDCERESFLWYMERYGPGFGSGQLADLWENPDTNAAARAFWAKGMKHIHFLKLDKVSVCCLSDTADVPLMWAHYADGHMGVCAVFHTGSILTVGDIGIQAVNYVQNVVTWNHADERRRHGATDRFNMRFDQAVLATKSLHWRYEREHRLIAHRRGRVDLPKTALAGVICGARMGAERMASIAAQVRDRYLGDPIIPVVRATVDAGTGDIWPTGFDQLAVGSTAAARQLPTVRALSDVYGDLRHPTLLESPIDGTHWS